MDLMFAEKLSAFLETFPTHLLYKKPEDFNANWVFWSEDEEERYQNQSSSASDVATNRMIYENIKSVFYHGDYYYNSFILQFWVPVTIGGIPLLSTSGQPFAVSRLDTGLAKYRLRSLEYKYNIGETNNLDIEQNLAMIISGATSSAFLNGLPELVNFKEQGSLLDRYALESKLTTSYVLPICCPSQSTSSCIGVVELSSVLSRFFGLPHLGNIERALKKVGLSVFDLQERIPYKSINGLKPVKDEIEEALKNVCESQNIGLAQVWISYEDENHVPFSSLEDSRKKRMLALKLTGYKVDDVDSIAFKDSFHDYYYGCDMLPLHTGEELVEKTFQDYEPRFCKEMSNLSDDMLMACAIPEDETESSALVICLRSISTGHFKYAFEFIWCHNSNYIISLEALLLTLKWCLPSFKFASGAELGDELNVIDVDNSTTSETQFFKIFQRKKVSPIPETMEKGKKQIVEDFPAYSKLKSKTAPISLSQKDIEQQYGNTMKEAAKNLSVSVSTLKRKYRGYSNSEWPGPSVAKRKVNGSCNNKRDKIEEDDGAIQDPLAANKNENTLTIKVEWADDMIKFHLDISQANFVNVEKEIGMRFKLSVGTYKIKYLDEDGEWILLISDQDLTDCIRSWRKLNQTVVRLRVQQSTQPIPGRGGSYEICRS